MKKVIVVEDEDILQKVLAEALTEEGYEVVTFTTGTEAIRETAAHNPDIVLLDIVLPGHDGFEVLQALKKDPKTKDIPIIVLSNLGGAESQQKAIMLGADAFIVKAEHELSSIIQLIQKILEKNAKV